MSHVVITLRSPHPLPALAGVFVREPIATVAAALEHVGTRREVGTDRVLLEVHDPVDLVLACELLERCFASTYVMSLVLSRAAAELVSAHAEMPRWSTLASSANGGGVAFAGDVPPIVFPCDALDGPLPSGIVAITYGHDIAAETASTPHVVVLPGAASTRDYIGRSGRCGARIVGNPFVARECGALQHEREGSYLVPALHGVWPAHVATHDIGDLDRRVRIVPGLAIQMTMPAEANEPPHAAGLIVLATRR